MNYCGGKYKGLSILIMTIFCSFCFSYLKPVDTYSTASTLTLSVIDKLSLNVSSVNSDGVFATSDLDTNNISVLTNNGTGYLLGIKASTEGRNALINTSDSSKTIPSHTISAGVSKTNYENASYASANNLNNTWGFRPSKYYDTTNNITIDNTSSNLYFPGPSSATNQFIIDKTTSANATANEYNIALGTRVNSSTAPGKYTDTFIITAVTNPTIYSISYNKNTTDTVTNMPTNVVNQPTFDETVNIDSTVPARDGFNFKGWCTVQVADGADCTGISYSAGSNWIIDQTMSSNSLALYARWKLYIQDLTLSQCQKNVGVNGNSANIGDSIIVYDKRDENEYTVRYINGRCWMTQNLRITGTIPAEYSNFTGNDFNVSQYDLVDKTHCGADASTSDLRGLVNVCSHDSGNDLNGAWYNFAAATAGQIIGHQNSSIPTGDICPKNWHLPSGPGTTSGTEFNLLAGNTSAGWQQGNDATSAFQGVGGGTYVDGTYNPSVNGMWWAQNPMSVYARYGLAYGSGDGWFRSDYMDTRYIGQYVRCVRSS